MHGCLSSGLLISEAILILLTVAADCNFTLLLDMLHNLSVHLRFLCSDR